ncbi:MAG: hypothetical protein AMJ46_06215 [Latescibacteria bacterium DG_63]|nr:MAG: hypothetical protein AMJ46_06215 [Latescibacteria bacterium DG_63]
MKQMLLISVYLCCLTVPALGLAAGNANPHIYLEIFDFGSSEPDPVPEYVCTCSYPVDPFPDFAEKTPGASLGYVAVHIAKVENGFLGLPFGM